VRNGQYFIKHPCSELYIDFVDMNIYLDDGMITISPDLYMIDGGKINQNLDGFCVLAF
jgi:hypothetical protein